MAFLIPEVIGAVGEAGAAEGAGAEAVASPANDFGKPQIDSRDVLHTARDIHKEFPERGYGNNLKAAWAYHKKLGSTLGDKAEKSDTPIDKMIAQSTGMKPNNTMWTGSFYHAMSDPDHLDHGAVSSAGNGGNVGGALSQIATKLNSIENRLSTVAVMIHDIINDVGKHSEILQGLDISNKEIGSNIANIGSGLEEDRRKQEEKDKENELKNPDQPEETKPGVTPVKKKTPGLLEVLAAIGTSLIPTLVGAIKKVVDDIVHHPLETLGSAIGGLIKFIMNADAGLIRFISGGLAKIVRIFNKDLAKSIEAGGNALASGVQNSGNAIADGLTKLGQSGDKALNKAGVLPQYETTQKREAELAAQNKTNPYSESGSSGNDQPVPKISGMEDVKNRIKIHEGKRLTVYKDSLGLPTIGYGHLIKPGENFTTISEKQANDMFEEDFAKHAKAAQNIPGYNSLNDGAKGALIDMTFNMGPGWYRKWPKFTKALQEGDIAGAAQQLSGSKWEKQVGNRAREDIALIAAGGSHGKPSGGSSASLSASSGSSPPMASPPASMVNNGPTHQAPPSFNESGSAGGGNKTVVIAPSAPPPPPPKKNSPPSIPAANHPFSLEDNFAAYFGITQHIQPQSGF
jgi:lysozyme